MVSGPRVAPDMKLLEIDGRYADVCEALLCVLANIFWRIDIVERVLRPRRPSTILRWYFRRRVEPLVGMPFQELREETLAVAVSIGPRGVEEVASERYRAIERRERLLVLTSRPP